MMHGQRNVKTALKCLLLILPYKFSLLYGCRIGIFFITVSEKAGLLGFAGVARKSVD